MNFKPNQNKPLSHPKYRPDIDGLRAIAVISVVLFHAFPTIFPGGFIGVDIFFVISGFLISTIIYENIEKNSFNFYEFYSRRIKRIFPALFFVIISSYIFGWFALLSEEYKHLAKHIASGVMFISNFVLWDEAGYFDNSSELKPLLHLWSLSIEEQFYLFWPLTLWFAYKFRLNILNLIILSIALSFYYNISLSFKDIVASFYSPLTRFWELILGAFLAWLTFNNRVKVNLILTKLCTLFNSIIYQDKTKAIDNKSLRDMISIIGFLMLIFGFAQINKSLTFPSFWAVIPVLGTCFIISAGPNGWINRIVLTNKFAIWFGLISFPLYLWHWPLLSFAKIIEGPNLDNKIIYGIIILSILFAWTTYKFIEIPIRTSKDNRSVTFLLILSLLIFGFFGYTTFVHNGYEFRHAEKVSNINRFDRPYRESCQNLTGHTYDDDWCNSGTNNSKATNTALVGDSFANAYSPMLSAFSDSLVTDNFSFIQFGRGQCPTLLGYGPSYCENFAKKTFEYIKNSSSITTVVLSSFWPAYFNLKDFYWVKHIESPESFRFAFEKTIHAYTSIGKRIIVFLPPPVGSYPKSCIVRPIRITETNSCQLSLQLARDNERGYREYLITFLKKNNISYFDPFNYFCNDSQCKIIENGKIFTADGWHLSVFGGEFLAKNAYAELLFLFFNY